MFGGLVGYSDKEITIENCYVDGGKVSSKDKNCGGLAGNLLGASAIIKGSWNSAHVSCSSSYALNIGGIIGYSNGKTEMYYCNNKGLIENTYSGRNIVHVMGGLIGFTHDDVLMKYSYNSGEVRGNSSREIGGLIGDMYGGTIENCYNTGKISGIRAIGGLCGWTSNDNKNLKILDSYNIGNIEAKLMDGMYSETGGIIGCACSKYEIKNCYNQGNITALGGYVGGITGYSGGLVEMHNCYNTGEILTTMVGRYIGGMLGFCAESSSITNVFNSGDIESKVFEEREADIGGIIGWTNTTELTNCYNFNNISSKSGYVGGITGINNASNVVYTSCFNSGNILGEKGYVGGISGYNTSKTGFNKCHNKGDLLSNLDNPNANEKGEIVGYASQLNVTECTYLQKTTNAKDNGANPKEQSEINDIMSVQNFVNLMNSYVTDNNKDSTKTKLKTWKVENEMPIFAE